MKNLKDKLSERIEKQSIPQIEMQSPNIVLDAFPATVETMQFSPEFAALLNEAKNRINMLQDYVQRIMISGIDYGLIPGCPKPSLLKPGAEKLLDFFGYSKLVTVLNRIENLEDSYVSYEVKTSLISKNTGVVEAEGVGSCNSREQEYKNSDPFCIANTLLKMAEKRSLVDACLFATRSSGLFTQDLETLFNKPDSKNEPILNSHIKEVQSIHVKTPIDKSPKIESANNSATKPNKNKNKYATKEELSELVSIVKDKKIPVDKVKGLLVGKYRVMESKYLTSVQTKEFKQYLIDIK